MCVYVSVLGVYVDVYCYIKLHLLLVIFFQATEKDEAASVKDWILRYAEQSSDDEEEEEEEEGGKKKPHNPELDEKFDPVSEIYKSL